MPRVLKTVCACYFIAAGEQHKQGLLHQVDCYSALRNDAGHVNSLGLYDLQREIMPAGKAYKKLIGQWQKVLKAESYGLNF